MANSTSLRHPEDTSNDYSNLQDMFKRYQDDIGTAQPTPESAEQFYAFHLSHENDESSKQQDFSQCIQGLLDGYKRYITALAQRLNTQDLATLRFCIARHINSTTSGCTFPMGLDLELRACVHELAVAKPKQFWMNVLARIDPLHHWDHHDVVRHVLSMPTADLLHMSQDEFVERLLDVPLRQIHQHARRTWMVRFQVTEIQPDEIADVQKQLAAGEALGPALKLDDSAADDVDT